MHIGFLTNEYPPLESGGIGTSIRNLGHALVRQGHRVTVVGWGRAGQWNDHGVSVHYLRATGAPKMGWLLNRRAANSFLKDLVRHDGLEIVEAPDWCGLSAGLQPGCPVVIRMNGTAKYFGHLLHEPVRGSVQLAEWMALRGADALCSVSRFTAGVTRRLFGLKKPIQVVGNGIDVEQFRPPDPGSVEPHRVLYFGSIVRKKGVLDLCMAFNHMVERCPHARLRLIGRDVPDKKTGSTSTWTLCRQLLSAAARERVQYDGLMQYEELSAVVQTAAVCVFPSHAEALPLSWMEAMACARPIVASNIGWGPELIEDGVSGLLVAPTDHQGMAAAMERLLRNPAQAQALGEGAYQRARKYFSADVIARQSVAWYGAVLKQCRT